jgi:chromosome segregation ATPase
MRPQEILGMVEEAAGTRMFEERKSRAQKTIQKKQTRVVQITSLLAEEIVPKLDALREEKRGWVEFVRGGAELERVGRVLRAWEWVEGGERVKKREGELGKLGVAVEKVGAARWKAEMEIEAAEGEMRRVLSERDREVRKGGKVARLEEAVREAEVGLVKLRTRVEIGEGEAAEEEKRLGGLGTELAEVRSCLLTRLGAHTNTFISNTRSSKLPKPKNALSSKRSAHPTQPQNKPTTHRKAPYPPPRSCCRRSSQGSPPPLQLLRTREGAGVTWVSWQTPKPRSRRPQRRRSRAG